VLFELGAVELKVGAQMSVQQKNSSLPESRNKQLHVDRQLDWLGLSPTLPHHHQIPLALVYPKHVYLIAVRHPNLHLTLHASRPLDTADLPYVRILPEAVRCPEDVVALIHEHEI